MLSRRTFIRKVGYGRAGCVTMPMSNVLLVTCAVAVFASAFARAANMAAIDQLADAMI